MGTELHEVWDQREHRASWQPRCWPPGSSALYALLAEGLVSVVAWTCRLALWVASLQLLPDDLWLQVANDTIIILLGLVFCVMQPLIAPLAGKCSLQSTHPIVCSSWASCCNSHRA